MDLSKLRKEYEEEGIDTANALDDPIKQFQIWYDQAKEAQIPEPDAAVIASVNEEEYPSSRFVLVRKVDEHGFVFYNFKHKLDYI